MLNALGYVWVPTTNDSEASLLKAHWIIAESSGDIVYSSTDSFVDYDSYEEISLCKLQELVAQNKSSEQGLISGADALRALADGKEVERKLGIGWCDDVKKLSAETILHGVSELRIKPRTITLNVEIPAPFEPKMGETYYFITTSNSQGFDFTEFNNSDGDKLYMQLGAYRSASDASKAFEALRGGIKG